jgi:TPR repeat protein
MLVGYMRTVGACRRTTVRRCVGTARLRTRAKRQRSTTSGGCTRTVRGWAQDNGEAARWYRMAVDQGNATARAHIGRLYMRWYRGAADQGNASARTVIGQLFEYGCGVPRDYGEAMRRFRMAADQGDGAAQNNVGWLHANGLGVPRDPSQARVWMQRAAANGDELAKQWLAAN